VSDIDSIPPVATIDGPTGTSGPDVTLNVDTEDHDGVWFDCQVDGGTWSRCEGTVELTGLAPGTHDAAAHAYDAAANRSVDAARLTWTVAGGAEDSVPPEGTISIANGAAYLEVRQPGRM
jgi:hypothetical protein